MTPQAKIKDETKQLLMNHCSMKGNDKLNDSETQSELLTSISND